MKFLKKLSCAAAVALSFAGAAHAEAVLNNWVFNPNGTGFGGGTQVNEYLDITGNAFIQLGSTASAGAPFSFKETGVFNITSIDGSKQPFQFGTLTATFQANGSGTAGTSTTTGNFIFNSGTINIYKDTVNDYGSTTGIYGANNGTLIASFDVLVGGGGSVDASGNPTGNGQVTVKAQAKPGALVPGYFFLGNGQDLSSQGVLSFAFTNANPVTNPTGNLVPEVACEFAGFTGPGCTTGTYANSPGNYFFVSNNGQFKLSEVPEPGSLALFGIAMLGAGVTLRKRNKKA
jgi:hypothetical protein